jgi:hypothetical protein
MDTEIKSGSLPEDDELVPFARIVKESGMTAAEVRLALGEAGELVRVFPGRDPQGREYRRVKLYPLKYTLALVSNQGDKREPMPEIEDDELVPLARLMEKLGWAPATVRLYLQSASRTVRTFPDPKDGRRKLYPLRHTVNLLRREHGRVEARRLRAKEEGAAYWVALASQKVATRRLRKLASDVAAVSRELEAAFEGLRRTPPFVLEIRTLPDPGLELIYPLTVLVAPLRLVYWRATVPEIPLRGEAKTPEEAVLDLRDKMAATFQQLQEHPSSDPDLWRILNEVVRVRT